MTKIILHGGYLSIKNENNEMYYKETMSSPKKNVTVLLVYLARKDVLWKSLEKIDRKKLRESKPKGQNAKFLVASRDSTTLREQIISSDIIFIRGGRDAPLFRAFKKIRGLNSLLKGKTIAGSSAGAYLLSRYCYNQDYNQIEEGLGILPIKIYCHYKPRDKPKLEKLKSHNKRLKTIILKDTDFVVMHK